MKLFITLVDLGKTLYVVLIEFSGECVDIIQLGPNKMKLRTKGEHYIYCVKQRPLKTLKRVLFIQDVKIWYVMIKAHTFIKT